SEACNPFRQIAATSQGRECVDFHFSTACLSNSFLRASRRWLVSLWSSGYQSSSRRLIVSSQSERSYFCNSSIFDWLLFLSSSDCQSTLSPPRVSLIV